MTKFIDFLRLLFVMHIAFVIAGCSHENEVVEMIEQAYPQFKAGGDVEFDSYKESKRTKGRIRTFKATGILKWENKWYTVKRVYESEMGIPEVVIVSEMSELNKGVCFEAIFYKGDCSKKGSVKLDVDSNIGACFTEDGLLEKYKSKCLYFGNKKILGAKIDVAEFKKLFNESIAVGNKVVFDIKKNISDLQSRTAKCLAEEYKNYNYEKLDEYIKRCENLYSEYDNGDSTYEVRRKLSYFADFPIENFGQAEALKCNEEVLAVRSEYETIKNSVNKRMVEANALKNMNKRKGVTYVRGITSIGSEDKSKPQTLKIASGPITITDVEPSNTVTMPNESKRQGSNRIFPQQRVIRRVRGVKSSGGDVVLPSSPKTMTIKMPQ